MPEVEAESGLVKMFGGSPVVKVVDTLMDHPDYEYTKKELAEVNDISRPTLYKIWGRLEELGIVRKRRKIGNTQLFSLNKESEVVKSFYEMEHRLEEARSRKRVKV